MATATADGTIVDPAVMVGKSVIAGMPMPVEPMLAIVSARPRLSAFSLDYSDLAPWMT